MTETTIESWEQLLQLIEKEDSDGLREFIDSLPASESIWAVSHLTEESQQALLSLLSPDYAAWVVEMLDESQAAELLENLETDQVTAIVGEMKSNDQADLLSAFD